jgi:hypothetical protein
MGGQIADATIVAAPKQRNTDAEKADIKAAKDPDAWKDKPAKLRQEDRDARWTVKFSKAKIIEQRDITIPAFGEPRRDRSLARLIRVWNVTDASFYKWRSKFGGMEVSETKRLKVLEEENAKLKKLLAESMMDVSTLREKLGKTSEARVEEERREACSDCRDGRRRRCIG